MNKFVKFLKFKIFICIFKGRSIRAKFDENNNDGFYIYVNQATSFMILIGVFFPSATGFPFQIFVKKKVLKKSFY